MCHTSLNWPAISRRTRNTWYRAMIVINLDVMLARRKMTLSDLSDQVGITLSNMSILKTGKVRALRISTLDSICRILDCTPGDILEYRPENLEPDLKLE